MQLAKAPTAAGSPKKDRSPTALGVSMLLLLLSSIPMDFNASRGNSLSSERNSGPNSQSYNTAQQAAYANTPYLAYVTSLVLGDDIDMDSMLTLGENEENDNDHRRGRRSTTPSSSAAEDILALSTSGSRSTSNPPSPSAASSWLLQHPLAPAAPLTLAITASSTSPIGSVMQSTDVLGNILKYLNLSEVDACRLVNTTFAAASEAHVVDHSVTGYRFLKFDANAPCPDTHKANVCGSKWNCANCNTVNFHMSESCVHCKENNGIYRVFLGQLRKEKTAELVRFVIRQLFPEMQVYHVESHTNPMDGRGKGCAWVYVSSFEEASQLLSLNKRMFVDVNASGEEGIWFCNSALTDDLAGFAVEKAYAASGRHAALPRQPIVAELPKNSRQKAKTTRRSPKKAGSSPAPSTAPASVDDSFGSNEQAYAPQRHHVASAAKQINYHQRKVAPSTAPRRVVTAEHYLPEAESARYTPPPQPTAHHEHYAAHSAMCNCASCYNHRYHMERAALSRHTSSSYNHPQHQHQHNPYQHQLVQHHPQSVEVDYTPYYPSHGHLMSMSNHRYVPQQQQHEATCACEHCINNAW